MSEDADKTQGTGGKPPLSRSLGQFFGILIRAAKEDVSAPKAVVVKEEVMEKVVETEGGKITLRRRVIDEVVEGGKEGA